MCKPKKPKIPAFPPPAPPPPVFAAAPEDSSKGNQTTGGLRSASKGLRLPTKTNPSARRSQNRDTHFKPAPAALAKAAAPRVGVGITTRVTTGNGRGTTEVR